MESAAQSGAVAHVQQFIGDWVEQGSDSMAGSYGVQEVMEVLQQLQGPEAPRCYVMQRAGPTSFVIHDELCNINRKVTIGCRQTCSCRLVC